MTNPNKQLENLSNVESLRRSGRVRRFHNQPNIIGQQTVAEHTFGVLNLLLQLHPDPSLNLIKAALVHDGAEGETGDIPAPVKWAYRSLGREIDAIEEEVMMRHGWIFPVSVEESTWLKACDMLEGLQFARDQRILGNTGAEQYWQAWCYAFAAMVYAKGEQFPKECFDFWKGLVKEYDRITGWGPQELRASSEWRRLVDK